MASNVPDPAWPADPIDSALAKRFFDTRYYCRANPDVVQSGSDPFTHYMTHGWREGRDPTPEFSTSWYLALKPDIAAAGVHPFLHWIVDTAADSRYGRPPPEAFDPIFYLDTNPDVAAAGISPLAHYLNHGWREGRDPSTHFSTRWYRLLVPGLAEAPIVHWIREGRAAGLPARPPAEDFGLELADLALLVRSFDRNFYLKTYPDVAVAEMDSFIHFMINGWREGRDPSLEFSTNWYLAENEDIASSGLNPFRHWVLHGRAEGRLGRPPWGEAEHAELVRAFDAAYYVAANPDVALSGMDPFVHYMIYGWREGRDPSSEFSTTWYLEQNSDIAAAGTNPFTHWVLHGRSELRPGRPFITANPKPHHELYVDEGSIDWADYPADDLEAINNWFDRDFYVERYPNVVARGIDPVVHYLLIGWRLGYDPSPNFSTRYYLECYPDIARSKQNPFVHWCRHGRHELRATQSYVDIARRTFQPTVSVIVPNYRHATYLPQRLRSIAEQTYKNLEIIILDDCSPDNSREVIRDTVAELGIDARLEFNEINSGNVFSQWQKGISLATGELIWICESDDFCDTRFLEHLVPAFADEAVQIAFGRIQFCDAEGSYMAGLDAYREGAEAGIWSEALVRPAAEWFNGGFGVNNVIPNVGGCLFRRMDLPQEVWDTARSYRICGDWYLYIQIAGAGKIAYEPKAISYFRQHGSNTSASNFHQPYYYDENRRILMELIRQWGIGEETRRKFLSKVESQYRHFGLVKTQGDFHTFMQREALLCAKREKLHVQLYFLGFHTGGGEFFPINLANALIAQGMLVSMVAIDMLEINADMQRRLDRRIPVYHVSDLAQAGRKDFFCRTGASVINSHNVSCDFFLANLDAGPIEVPYVVTLHGSYAGLHDSQAPTLQWILANVDQWIYTADRNLEFFEARDVDWDSFVKLPNALPRDDRPALFTRADLGIGENETVFTMIARGIKRKGWRAVVEAFRWLSETRGREDVHLLLIGEGEATETARRLANNLPRVHFLGYQSEINGILRLSDCLLLPSRFEGESYPLCLIQAFQEHVPAIATDIGEIRPIMTDEGGRVAGILLKNRRDSRAYFAALAQHMEEMCDPVLRAKFTKIAADRAPIFDIERLALSYIEIYKKVQLRQENPSKKFF